MTSARSRTGKLLRSMRSPRRGLNFHRPGASVGGRNKGPEAGRLPAMQGWASDTGWWMVSAAWSSRGSTICLFRERTDRDPGATV